MKIDLNRSWTVAELRAHMIGAGDNLVLEFVKTPKKDQTGECWCGCGASTKSRFAPGHDSKFHSLAKRVARGQEAMPESFVNADAEADFMKWHDATSPLPVKAPKAKAAKKSVEERVVAAVSEPHESEAWEEAAKPSGERFSTVERLEEGSDEWNKLMAEVTMMN